MESTHPYDPMFFTCTEGSPMRRALAMVARIAPSDAHVLLVGEPGTGKETLARLIHVRSRRTGAFVVLRSGSRSDERQLFEELFGPDDGTEEARAGLFAAARGGTLYVEDVDRLPPSSQAALAFRLHHGDAGPRVVATTSRDVHEAVGCGRFRRDLYDALACTVALPPVRERPEDVAAVFDRLWAEAGRSDPLPPDALELIRRQPWPGNVRELAAFVTRLALMTDRGAVTLAEVRAQLSRPGERRARPTLADHGPAHRHGGHGLAAAPREVPAAIDLPRLLGELENALIDWALEVSADNRTAAGELLGLQRTTLVEKLRRREAQARHATA